MQFCFSAVCGILLLAVNPLIRADEDKDSPAAYRATIATQQEEIKELKRKLSLARMEVQKLKHKLHPPKGSQGHYDQRVSHNNSVDSRSLHF
jgi:hypothetical protein